MKDYKKNPYELRYDVLVMAKNMADKVYEDNLELTKKAIELQKENSEQLLEAWSKYIPTMYTPEKLKEMADTLYGFVSNDK